MATVCSTCGAELKTPIEEYGPATAPVCWTCFSCPPSENKDIQDEILDLEEDIKDLESEIEGHQDEIDELEDEIEDNRAKIKSLKATRSKKAVDVTKQLYQWKAGIAKVTK